MKSHLPLALFFATASLASAGEYREFTNTEGVKINAEVLDLKDGVVQIRRGGTNFDVPVENLSAEDQEWLKQWDMKRQGLEDEIPYSELVFEDDFSAPAFGEKWSHYKSAGVIQDGVLVGKTIDIKDHAGVEATRFEGRKDMMVGVKFKFAGPEAERFNVWFDDKDFKGSHAGHICNVTVSPTSVAITDAKTGNMENSIYEKKNAPGGLDAETTEMLKTKTATFKVELDRDEWHQLRIFTKDDTVRVKIDGEEVGSFASEGNTHETKSVVSFTTYVNDVHYDDVVIKAAPVDK
ncbi:MAG: hypothetical protein KDK99_01865 [Verrucomicrobiales bacterium]|nr:hypothetical protein [Verrucomicrobiales bacterium]